MAKKAIHTGICQCCGRRQVLPGDKLSKHGYTVEYGFFNGVCFGAGEDPLEVSCELVKADIVRCKKEEKRLTKYVRQLRKPATDTTNVWVHDYENAHRDDKGRLRKAGYSWRKVALRKNEAGSIYYIKSEFSYRAGQKEFIDSYTTLRCENSLEAVATYLNSRYADTISKNELAFLRNHIARQEEIVKHWKPQPLQLRKN